MMQYVIIAALIAFVYFFYIKKKPAKVSSSKDKKSSKQDASDTIECATCKIYCELDEAILSSGKYYCSRECVAKG